MKRSTILIGSFYLLFWSCNTYKAGNYTREKQMNDSLALVKMVNERENAMKKKDMAGVMTQFSDDATFINSKGYYFANKVEIEKFHHRLTQNDTIGYHYKAGNVQVRLLDRKNALVYYPWRVDWYNIANAKDTLVKEIGLMTLTAQKRKTRWLWVAITNQHTPEYFENLTKHKRQ